MFNYPVIGCTNYDILVGLMLITLEKDVFEKLDAVLLSFFAKLGWFKSTPKYISPKLKIKKRQHI